MEIKMKEMCISEFYTLWTARVCCVLVW